MTIEYVIPPKSRDYKPKSLEAILHNLEVRLQIQKDWVAQTEKNIEDIKERMKNEEGKYD